ncbi:unnamed protein product [Jaminaea pallidilutea]
MVHADAALLPANLQDKRAFYAHLREQLASLLSDQRAWVTNLSNASSILHNSLNTWRSSGRDEQDTTASKSLNWTGFYLLSGLFPEPRPPLLKLKGQPVPTLALGPFHGMPACQAIPSIPGKGVCADGSAKLPPATIRVSRTDDYPGHIACDSLSKSELVIPIVVPLDRLSRRDAVLLAREGGQAVEWSGRGNNDDIIVGLLDIDCVEEDGFDETDQEELEGCVKVIAESCDW